MIDLEIGFLASYLLLATVVAYAWFTRDQREPGRHRYPGLPPADSYPYPELSPFPELRPPDSRVGLPPHPRKRLATTTELRALAYDGDMAAINAEVAAFRAQLSDTTDWTTAA
jgi:hypothetical protein